MPKTRRNQLFVSIPKFKNEQKKIDPKNFQFQFLNLSRIETKLCYITYIANVYLFRCIFKSSSKAPIKGHYDFLNIEKIYHGRSGTITKPYNK